MKVNIYGSSNLGTDLCLMAHEYGHDVKGDSDKDLHEYPDIVFNTVGGSASTKTDDLWIMNITNNKLHLASSKAMIISFSSNAAMEPWRTPYASIKASMEQIPSLRVVRVGNLYGKHFPEKTFPGKIIKNPPISLPTNPIVPMPTDYLADQIFKNIFTISICSTHDMLRPSGFTTVSDWGEKILDRPVPSVVMTEDRNQIHTLCGLGRHWEELWEERKGWFK